MELTAFAKRYFRKNI